MTTDELLAFAGRENPFQRARLAPLGPAFDAVVFCREVGGETPCAPAFAAAGWRVSRHLLMALEDERPVGFVTGIETVHPDKGTEMYLYELGWGAQKSFGRAAAVAWILFLIIVVIGLINFAITRRISSSTPSSKQSSRKGTR